MKALNIQELVYMSEALTVHSSTSNPLPLGALENHTVPFE